MLKQSIGIGMLFIAGHAYSSNIIVTTTADTKADDQNVLCVKPLSILI